jgi:hypothetical protein
MNVIQCETWIAVAFWSDECGEPSDGRGLDVTGAVLAVHCRVAARLWYLASGRREREQKQQRAENQALMVQLVRQTRNR